jgi:hypothetical protein
MWNSSTILAKQAATVFIQEEDTIGCGTGINNLNSLLESKEVEYHSLHHWERELKQEAKMTFKKNWQKKEKQAACSNIILDISDYYFPFLKIN